MGGNVVKFGLLEKTEVGGYVGIVDCPLPVIKRWLKVFTGDFIETAMLLSISRFPFFSPPVCYKHGSHCIWVWNLGLCFCFEWKKSG